MGGWGREDDCSASGGTNDGLPFRSKTPSARGKRIAARFAALSSCPSPPPLLSKGSLRCEVAAAGDAGLRLAYLFIHRSQQRPGPQEGKKECVKQKPACFVTTPQSTRGQITAQRRLERPPLEPAGVSYCLLLLSCSSARMARMFQRACWRRFGNSQRANGRPEMPSCSFASLRWPVVIRPMAGAGGKGPCFRKPQQPCLALPCLASSTGAGWSSISEPRKAHFWFGFPCFWLVS